MSTDFLTIRFDHNSVIERGIRHLCAHGRRRIGVFAPAGQSGPVFRKARRIALECGAECRDEWLQTLPFNDPDGRSHLFKLLFKLPPEELPDGIFIADDNLIGAVLAGIAEAGKKVPEDFLIASHSNFPAHPPKMPIKLFGFNIPQLLEQALTMIDTVNQRGIRPPAYVLTACSDTEFENANL